MTASPPLPPVTVVLPVYNAGIHLAAALDSILGQTHRDLQIIAIDDGSTDGSGTYLDAVDDDRLTVVHRANHGLVATLNFALGLAQHELVARMDADDISMPDRLGRQAELLSAHGDWSAVACDYDIVDDAGQHVATAYLPTDTGCLERQLYFRNVLPHGGMLMRRAAVLNAGGYRDIGPAEDYDLWTRLLQHGPIGSVADVLYQHRLSPGGISSSSRDQQKQSLRDVRAALHEAHQLNVPTVRALLTSGSTLARRDPGGRALLADYLFDHAALAVLMLRAGRRGAAARLLACVVLLGVRRPAAAGQMPPVRARLSRFRTAGDVKRLRARLRS